MYIVTILYQNVAPASYFFDSLDDAFDHMRLESVKHYDKYLINANTQTSMLVKADPKPEPS